MRFAYPAPSLFEGRPRGGRVSLDQRMRTRRAPTMVQLRVHNPPPRLRKVNLVFVRSVEEVVGRVRHQLSLTNCAGSGGGGYPSGVYALDEGGFGQEVTA